MNWKKEFVNSINDENCLRMLSSPIIEKRVSNNVCSFNNQFLRKLHYQTIQYIEILFLFPFQAL